MLTKQMDIERLDNFIKEDLTSRVLDGVNLNDLRENGIFYVMLNCANKPLNIAGILLSMGTVNNFVQLFKPANITSATHNIIYQRAMGADGGWYGWEKIPRTMGDFTIDFYSTKIDLSSSSVVSHIVSEASYGYSSIDPTPNRLYVDVSLPAIATNTSKTLLEVKSTGTYYTYLYNLFKKYAYLTNLTISNDTIQSIQLAPTSTTNGKLCYLFLSHTPASKSSDGYAHMSIGLKPIVAITNGSILKVCMAV